MKKLITALGMLGIFAFAVPVFAQYATVSTSACPQLTYSLYRGLSDYRTGGQVTQLQQFLSARYYQLVTGYFGAMTYANVAQFQREQGIYPVTGGVGPLTRAAIARACGGGGGTTNASFSASPTYGVAPLSVTFTITAEAGEYTVEFGDGQSTAVTMPAVQCFRAPCNTQTTKYHTYTSAGTYTARLMYQPPYYCPPGAYCAMMMPAPKQIGTATITVGGSSTGGVPSINGLDAPTSLSAGQTGTWTVRASAPSGTQLRYSVVWGDEGWGTVGSANFAQSNVQTSATFSHAYQNAGTYNPTFTISNDYGSVQTSASVAVSNNAQNASFSAYPTYGFAPLGVVFTTNVSGAVIDFGDGTSGKVSADCATSLGGSTNCNTGSYFASHTYAANGTYTATMKRIIGVREIFGGGDTNMYETIGTVTITVMTGWL